MGMTSVTLSFSISEGWLKPNWAVHRHSVWQARRRSVGTKAALLHPRLSCHRHRACQRYGANAMQLAIDLS